MPLPHETSVRERLRDWKPPEGYQLRREPLAQQIAVNGSLANNLTRPEEEDLAGDFLPDTDPDDRLAGEAFVKSLTLIQEHGGETDTMLRRGDLVQFSNIVQRPSYGVFLGIAADQWYEFYEATGKWTFLPQRPGFFSVPGFFDPAELNSLTPYLPDTETVLSGAQEGKLHLDMALTVPRNVSAPLLTKMGKFISSVDAVYLKYARSLDNAHKVLAHPTELKHMTLEDAIEILTGLPKDAGYPAELLSAVTNSLSRDFGFLIESRVWQMSRFMIVLPACYADSVKRVQKSLRAYQEERALVAGGLDVPVSVLHDATNAKAFFRKSRRLIVDSRGLRRISPDGAVYTCQRHNGPATPQLIQSLEFTDNDRDFIRVLKLELGSAFATIPNYKTLANAIVRAVGLHEPTDGNPISVQTCSNFLVEIGVFEPYTMNKPSEGHLFLQDRELDVVMDGINARIQAGETPEDAAGIHDTMGYMRKDWGDMPVFCIDSAETKEVDDGISVESIPERPGQYWIHIHVAHITSWASPDHVIGRLAELRQSSIYNATEVLPMLPAWVSEKFSVGSGKPVLTFSTRLDEDGRSLEYKIQPGVVRNVISATPEQVDDLLGNKRTEFDWFRLRCGPEPLENPQEQVDKHRANYGKLVSDHLRDLQILLQFATNAKSRRPLTPFSSQLSMLEVKASGAQMSPQFILADEPTHARFSTTDPTIELLVNRDFDRKTNDPILHVRNSASLLVEEAMLLAGVCAAEWSHQRNVPIVYTGTQSSVEGLDVLADLMREKAGQGKWDRSITSMLLRLFAIRVNSCEPHRQALSGIEKYAKATSPLRRHFDMLVHWQIDSALREEHRTGVSLVGSNPNSMPFLTYQRAALGEVIMRRTSRTVLQGWHKNAEQSHWALLAVARAFYYKEAALPSPLIARLEKTRSGKMQGTLVQLEMTCTFVYERPGEQGYLRQGELYEVEIEKIEVWTGLVLVRRGKRVAAAPKDAPIVWNLAGRS